MHYRSIPPTPSTPMPLVLNKYTHTHTTTKVVCVYINKHSQSCLLYCISILITQVLLYFPCVCVCDVIFRLSPFSSFSSNPLPLPLLHQHILTVEADSVYPSSFKPPLMSLCLGSFSEKFVGRVSRPQADFLIPQSDTYLFKTHWLWY